MRLFICTIYLILSTCTLGLAQSASIAINEEKLIALEKTISETESKSNALRIEMDQRLKHADSLKTIGSSEKVLMDYTAASFRLSQQFENTANLLEKLKLELNQIHSTLYIQYSVKIDSLKPLPKSSQLDGHLFVLMSKRLQVSPLAGNLHFNPQQLATIDFNTQDSLSLLIYKQYLQEASRELSSEIASIENKEVEIAQIAALESKADEFMEEMEESNMLQMVSSSAEDTRENSFYGNGDIDENFGNLVTANEQARSFFYLLNSLQNNPSINYPESSPLSYPELLDKLRETRSFLESYQKEVIRKLSQMPGK